MELSTSLKAFSSHLARNPALMLDFRRLDLGLLALEGVREASLNAFYMWHLLGRVWYCKVNPRCCSCDLPICICGHMRRQKRAYSFVLCIYIYICIHWHRPICVFCGTGRATTTPSMNEMLDLSSLANIALNHSIHQVEMQA